MDDTDGSTDWSGLDDLGSGVSNVASSILSSAGGLITATINAKTQQTTDKTYVSATNALPVNNPNAWQHYVLIGAVLLVVIVAVVEVSKRG